MDFILGLSSPHLYFVPVLVQLTLVTPLLAAVITQRKWAGALFALTPLYLVWLYAVVLTTGTQPVGYATLSPAWFVFYYAGMWTKIRKVRWMSRSGGLIKPLIACGTAVLLSIVEAYGILSLGLPAAFATSQIKVSSFLYSFAIISFLMTMKSKVAAIEPLLLTRLGDDSYGIYYVHVAWLIVLGPSVHESRF